MKQWPSQKVWAVGVILGHFNAMLRPAPARSFIFSRGLAFEHMFIFILIMTAAILE